MCGSFLLILTKRTIMKILIDPPHGRDVLGKASPDGRLREYKWGREICAEIVRRMRAAGYDIELTTTSENEPGLSARVKRINDVCARMGAKNVCVVSVHVNAAGNGKQWMNARGWEAWTSKGQTQGDKLAECLYDAAEANLPPGTPIRTDRTDGDRDKENNFTVLYKSKCAACLTENLFMDNKAEADWLLSADGREAIVELHVGGLINYVKKYSGTKR